MRIHSDFSRRACVAPQAYQWVPSGQPGVERAMLDRLGEDRVRATSLVRYAPGTSFSPHVHPGGEEILVLSGTFSDEDGHYPEGWYLRNPPGSRHRPFSEEGTLIFVKLQQMQARESGCVRINTQDPACWQVQGERATCALFADPHEQVCLQRLAAGVKVLEEPMHGAELLVLDGSLLCDGQVWERGRWMRLPAGDFPAMRAGAQGVSFYLKTNHLAAAATRA